MSVVEAEGTPAAAELEDVLAVGEAGALGVEGEHELLGLVEGFLAGGVEAAGVFEAFAEAVLIEGRGDFVVLLAGGGRLFGEGAGLKVGDLGGAVVACSLFADTLSEQAADAEAHEAVGKEVFFEEDVDHGRAEFLSHLGRLVGTNISGQRGGGGAEWAGFRPLVFPWEPGEERGNALLVGAVGVAFGFEGGFFGHGHAGDVEEEVKDGGGGEEADPAVG